MEKITDVLNELGKVTYRDLAGYFDLQPPEMLARLLVLEREGRAKNLNGYWMVGGDAASSSLAYNLTALDIKLLQSIPVGVWFEWQSLVGTVDRPRYRCDRLVVAGFLNLKISNPDSPYHSTKFIKLREVAQ
ncbi:hypothetical protein [Klebsiella quasipneumoniae]|uniref:hypothetical protein n=1 Tax=Klebsiella quasipneumoniae TaxID=1463165 RepID=UPI00109C0184|nr:hypothetical protein [Klebsiella quasipneumoniae]UDC53459.1 hypothetical protein LGM24_18250 [Klebsiella quasipneumoniae subsp. quasipneumoniae]VGP27355.1 hypothetical protein SB02110_03360 [Klebsiella quasipneumoniae subsp. quasipneumoniae]